MSRVAAVLSLCIVASSQAVTFTKLADFSGVNGRRPWGGLVLDSAGNLYGTASFGGTNDKGTVFKVPGGAAGSPGSIVTLASFNTGNGAQPEATLIADAAGNLYGTTRSGGQFGGGTVFTIKGGMTASPSPLTTVASFDSQIGYDLHGGVIADATGNLYGTASYSSTGRGIVYKIPSGTSASPGPIQALVRFNGDNGAVPHGGLTMDREGNLYGTTVGTGSSAFPLGSVYKVIGGATATPGSLVTLAYFNTTSGERADTAMTLGPDGNLYGTTPAGGGPQSNGAIYKVSPATTDQPVAVTRLAAFNSTLLISPEAKLLIDAAGNIFGTTSSGGPIYSYGAVFKIPGGATDTPGPLQILWAPSYEREGTAFRGELIADAQGNLYGTTYGGGASNMGTVFKLSDVGFVVPEPVSLTWLMAGASLMLRRRRGHG